MRTSSGRGGGLEGFDARASRGIIKGRQDGTSLGREDSHGARDTDRGTAPRAAVAGEVGPTLDEPTGPPGTWPATPGPRRRRARRSSRATASPGTWPRPAAPCSCTPAWPGSSARPTPLAYKKYRDQLVADCGGPSDPVEVMLIEQLALAHLNAGRLHFRAANAESLEGARVYGGLAVLLQGELRRTALALKAYRSQRQAAGRRRRGPARRHGRRGRGGTPRAGPEVPATANWVDHPGGDAMARKPNPDADPRRVAAGKFHYAKRKGLTPEGLERLRAAALANKPWLHSTGPRTPEGKARSAANGKLGPEGREVGPGAAGRAGRIPGAGAGRWRRPGTAWPVGPLACEERVEWTRSRPEIACLA